MHFVKSQNLEMFFAPLPSGSSSEQNLMWLDVYSSRRFGSAPDSLLHSWPVLGDWSVILSTFAETQIPQDLKFLPHLGCIVCAVQLEYIHIFALHLYVIQTLKKNNHEFEWAENVSGCLSDLRLCELSTQIKCIHRAVLIHPSSSHMKGLGILVLTEDETERAARSERKVARDRMMKACLALLVSPQ